MLANFDNLDPVCCLGRLEYPRKQLLNQRIEDALRLRAGQMVEGVILAAGRNPIPDAYCHGLIVPITLAFLDQNENESLQDAELFVDRMWKSKRKFALRGNGLYDRDSETPTSRDLSKSQTVSGNQSEKEGPKIPTREMKK
jgi:hypothetical protein